MSIPEGIRASAISSEWAESPRFIKLIGTLLFSLMLWLACFGPHLPKRADLFANNLPIQRVRDINIGINYYSELARSFIHGHTYFLGPLPREVTKNPDPYSPAAFAKGNIIQDASFFEGRYYLYFGVAPVLLFYVPIYLIFGQFPSDQFAALALLALSIIVFIKTWATFEPLLGGRRRAFLLASTVFLNPYFIYCIQEPTVHVVSRFSAILFTLLALNTVLRSTILKNVNPELGPRYPITDIAVFLVLAVSCKWNFLIDFAAFSALLAGVVFLNRTAFSKKQMLTGIAVATAGIASNLAYNYLRFNHLFESGMRWQTNGLELNKRIFEFHFKVKYLVYATFERAWEYLFTLPGYDLGSNHLIHSGIYHGLAFNPRFYSPGIVGYAPFLPLSAFIIYRAFEPATERQDLVLGAKPSEYWLTRTALLSLVGLHFLQLVFIPLSTTLYTYELLFYTFFFVAVDWPKFSKAHPILSGRLLYLNFCCALIGCVFFQR
jgi:hypothetical protein